MKKLFLSCSPKSTASRLWHSSTMPHHHSSNTSCVPPNYTRHLLQSQSECLAQHRRGLAAYPNERSSSAINHFGKLGRLWYGPLSSCNTMSMTGNQTVSRRYGHRASDDFSLTREWFVKRWLGDKKHEQKHKKRPVRSVPVTASGYSYTSVTEEPMTTPREMPPITQSGTGVLKPASPEELKVAPLLARSNLLVTRNIEWANIMLGFEQENRYAMVDPHFPESPAGFILEQSNVIARQILRTRRPFIAKITDSLGNELFRVRRPIWWITSSIYVEVDGKEIGVVHRRWHLWKRIYDLYLGNQQFAVVENPGFWYWTFTLKDIDGNVLAEIDRDWRGFGFELLTDAGQYVIRFGDVNPGSKSGPAKMFKDLEVDRPLRLSERAVALALAVSLDNDYFSRHGGWGLPFIAVAE